MESARPNKLLPWIAATKLLKATLLFIIAFGFHHSLGGNAQKTFEEYVHAIRVDSHNRVAQALLTKVTGLSEQRLHELGIALFLYGALFATEGTGLMLRKRWAEYLTIISTTVFLPLEIWELKKPEHRGIKSAVLLLNIAIVAYLVRNVAKTGKQTHPEPTITSPV